MIRESCTGVLERVGVRRNRSSLFAADAGCIFCQARTAPSPGLGQPAAHLNGMAAGDLVDLSRMVRFGDYELIGALPLSYPAAWLPPLSIRDTFVVDECAVWFCGMALSTHEFVWRSGDFNEVIWTIWQKRVPITPEELVTYFAAHGLPSRYHRRTQERYQDGIALLCRTPVDAPLRRGVSSHSLIFKRMPESGCRSTASGRKGADGSLAFPWSTFTVRPIRRRT